MNVNKNKNTTLSSNFIAKIKTKAIHQKQNLAQVCLKNSNKIYSIN